MFGFDLRQAQVKSLGPIAAGLVVLFPYAKNLILFERKNRLLGTVTEQ
jgi:hypothetical protein